MTGKRLASLLVLSSEFAVGVLVCSVLIFGGIQESCLALLFFFKLFVGTEEKQCNSSGHTLLLVPPALDTERWGKGGIGVGVGGARPYPPSYVEQYITWAGWIKYSMCPVQCWFYKTNKKRKKKCKNNTETHRNTHRGGNGKISPIVLTATTHKP